MDKEGIIQIAKKVVEAHPGTLNNPEDLIKNHLPMTYDIAEETANAIVTNYPSLKDYINIKKVAIAGGLHDIGRPLNSDQEFHEIRGFWLIRESGESWGLGKKGDVYRIAETMLPHGSVYETFVSPIFKEKRNTFFKENAFYIEEFGEIKPEMLLPDLLEQAIVDYAELSNLKGKRVGYRKRLEEAIDRYQSQADPRAGCIINGSQRRITLADKIQTLKDGAISLKEAVDLVYSIGPRQEECMKDCYYGDP